MSDIAEAPVVQSISCNGNSLQASWSAIADDAVTGYVFGLVYGDYFVVYGQVTSDTSVEFSIDLDASIDYAVQVYGYGSGSQGPTGSAGVIGLAPTITGAGAQAGSITVSWDAVEQTAVTGYTAALYDGTTLVTDATTTTTTATLTADASGDYTIEVQATGEATTGPWSEAASVSK